MADRLTVAEIYDRLHAAQRRSPIVKQVGLHASGPLPHGTGAFQPLAATHSKSSAA